MIIGLTGGIATGKSTVAKMMIQLNLPIIDADLIAREVVEPGEEAYDQIVQQFGPNILESDQTINRQMLGEIVFNNQEKRNQLNEIIHPAIRKTMLKQREDYLANGYDHVVMDIPLLFESKLTHFVDKVLLVYVSPEVQLKRLMERNHFSEEEAKSRINSQIPIIQKKEWSDEVIDNTGTIIESEQQLHTILKKWKVI